jgi:hypothetical protein
MMPTVLDLTARLDALRKARASGTLQVAPLTGAP